MENSVQSEFGVQKDLWRTSTNRIHLFTDKVLSMLHFRMMYRV